MVALIIVLVIFPIIYFINRSRKEIVVDEDSFSQNGVRVDFKTRTISIKKYTYNVDLITGIYWEEIKSKPKGMPELTVRAEVKIKVDDFNKPVHTVAFIGIGSPKDADEFKQRVCVALRKADGPSFK